MKNLAIIPARCGSKGLVDKNIKSLHGKPLIAYTIEAAKESNLFSHIIVSTDSEKYRDIAVQYGAEVPFIRSKQNSLDNSSSIDVIKEVLNNYKARGERFDTFALLQPTSPLRNSMDIKKAYGKYVEKNAVAIVSICETEHSPMWSNILPSDESLQGFIKTENKRQRQYMQTYYRLNGAIYIMNVESFYSNPDFYQARSFAYVMDANRSVDIDSEYDFKIAEMLIGMKYI